MTAKEFLDDKYNGKGYEAKIHDWGNNIHSNVSLTELLEEYHEHKLKLLGIGDVVGRSEQLPCDYCEELKPLKYCQKLEQFKQCY